MPACAEARRGVGGGEAAPGWTLAVSRNQGLVGRCLLVLDRPCARVTEVAAAEWADLHVALRRTESALAAVVGPDHLNLSFLMNVDRQVHLHVTPRYALPRRWRDLRIEDPWWGAPVPAEHTRALDPHQLGLLAGDLREALAATSTGGSLRHRIVTIDGGR